MVGVTIYLLFKFISEASFEVHPLNEVVEVAVKFTKLQISIFGLIGWNRLCDHV